MNEGHIAIAPSRKTLFTVLGGGLLAAGAILITAVLPAEYHIDPLGIGNATGLLQMSRPKEVEIALPASGSAVAHFYPRAFRTDTIDIPLAESGDADQRDQLEWKVRMQAGDTLVYSWTVEAPADQFYFDFHGESDPNPDIKLATYKKGYGIDSNGSMIAQFDGIHGWYVQNQSDKPVVLHLKLSGFYELRPNPSAAE